MKIRSLLLILLIGLPVASCAMENCDLSAAIGSEGDSIHDDAADEDGILFGRLHVNPVIYPRTDWEQGSKLSAPSNEEHVVEYFDDFPEAEVDADGNVVHQLRGRLSFEEQDVLNKHVGPKKFNETKGIIDYKLHGPQKPAEQPAPKDSDPKKDSSKE